MCAKKTDISFILSIVDMRFSLYITRGIYYVFLASSHPLPSQLLDAQTAVALLYIKQNVLTPVLIGCIITVVMRNCNKNVCIMQNGHLDSRSHN